jgi:hypothetical protein
MRISGGFHRSAVIVAKKAKSALSTGFLEIHSPSE